jgi:lipopolysaccharide/colanic/teichoic acid biosynthesis glycosyltransferase
MTLLRMPAGGATVLDRLLAELAPHAPGRALVLTPFEPGPVELAALGGASGVEAVVSPAGLARRLHQFEPSDWLVFRDAVTLAAEPLDLAPMLAELDAGGARHLVSPAGTSAGTAERLLLDAEGRVVRVQRYYERVTWSFASGVACSAVPVAALRGVGDLHLASLSELRASLASAGVPGRDLFIPVPTFDLRRESAFLALTERLLQPRAGRRGAARSAPSARVAPGAVLRGAVLVDADAEIGEGAVLVGPTVVGRGSRIGERAVVAQAVVAPGTDVPAGAVARQRVVTAAHASSGALVDDAAPRDAASPFGRLRESGETNPLRRLHGLKAPAERTVALVALAALAPLFAVVAALVKLTSPGPVFYGDRREGRGGRPFRCWKFRSMAPDAHSRQRDLQGDNEVDGPQFKLANDPRVTTVGRWLRRLNVDELPQLWNVARGEMSLVGPRPSPFRENQICVPWRDARLSVAPGITGLWQVCRDRSETSDFHQWIYYDLLYVNHASPRLDLKILAATVLTLGGRHPVPLRWLVRVDAPPADEVRPPEAEAQRAA